MDMPIKKRSTFSLVLARYLSNDSSLPDYNPPGDFASESLGPQGSSSLGLPGESIAREMAPQAKGILKSRNGLTRKADSSSITQKTASTPAHSQSGNGSAHKIPTTALPRGVEEFRSVERQLGVHARLDRKHKLGKSPQSTRIAGQLPKPRAQTLPEQEYSRRQELSISRASKILNDSESDLETIGQIDMPQKHQKIYQQGTIDQPSNEKVSLNLRRKETDALIPNDNHQERNPSKDFEVDFTTESMMSKNERHSTPSEEQRLLERKSQDSMEVGHVTDFREDELANSDKAPKRLTRSQPQSHRAAIANGTNSPKSLSSLPQITSLGKRKRFELDSKPQTTTGTPEVDSPKLNRWTKVNPEWTQLWKVPVIYPHQGDRFAAIVEKEDIERLDDGEFLNDNLINFYLRWLKHHFEEQYPAIAHRIYFQNTFFYKTLTSTTNNTKRTRGINYDNVARWTSKIDLLSFDYIIVPINESLHWYVAIICNAGKLRGLQPEYISGLEPRDESKKSEDPRNRVDAGKQIHSTQPSPNNLGLKRDEASRLQDPAPGVDALLPRSSLGLRDNRSEDERSEVEMSKDWSKVKKQNSCIDLCDEYIESQDFTSKLKTVLNSGPSTELSRRLQRKGAAKSHPIRKLDPNQPRIITLDSLGLKHSPTCTNLKEYLIAEIKSKKKIDIPTPGALGMTAVNIPQQSNLFDCGIFLLRYIEQFLKDPDNFIHNIIQGHGLQIEFEPASSMRDHIRQTLFKLQEKQIDEAERLLAEKRDKRRHAKAENRSNNSKKGSNVIATTNLMEDGIL